MNIEEYTMMHIRVGVAASSRLGPRQSWSSWLGNEPIWLKMYSRRFYFSSIPSTSRIHILSPRFVLFGYPDLTIRTVSKIRSASSASHATCSAERAADAGSRESRTAARPPPRRSHRDDGDAADWRNDGGWRAACGRTGMDIAGAHKRRPPSGQQSIWGGCVGTTDTAKYARRMIWLVVRRTDDYLTRMQAPLWGSRPIRWGLYSTPRQTELRKWGEGMCMMGLV